MKRHFDGEGRIVISASEAMQLAMEAQDAGSLFTSALVEGLQTGAADQNRDRIITVDELFTYAADRVREQATQRPRMWALGISGDLIIARVPAGVHAPAQPLPEGFMDLLTHPNLEFRLSGVDALARLASGEPGGTGLTARNALRDLAENEPRGPVASAAAGALRRVDATATTAHATAEATATGAGDEEQALGVPPPGAIHVPRPVDVERKLWLPAESAVSPVALSRAIRSSGIRPTSVLAGHGTIGRLDIRVIDDEIRWSTGSRGEDWDRRGTEQLDISVRRRASLDRLLDLLQSSIDLARPKDALSRQTFWELMRGVGQELFELMFARTLREETSRLLQALHDARIDVLRVRLEFSGTHEGWLSRLPWEYLHTAPGEQTFEPHGVFLSAHGEVLMSRRLPSPSRRVLEPVDGPISVLLACSSPGRAEELSMVDSDTIVSALVELTESGDIALESLLEDRLERSHQVHRFRVTRKVLADKLRSMRPGPTVVHLVGPVRLQDGRAQFALATADGDVDWMSATDLSRYLARGAAVQVVVLQACQNELPEPYIPLLSMAHELAVGVPAVVALPEPLSFPTAGEFGGALYESLSRGLPIDLAVETGRRAIGRSTEGGELTFGLPIAYLSGYTSLTAPAVVNAAVARRDVVSNFVACPRCRDENPHERKFCRSCALALRCPACASRYPDPLHDVYCGECGEPVRQAVAGPQLDLPGNTSEVLSVLSGPSSGRSNDVK